MAGETTAYCRPELVGDLTGYELGEYIVLELIGAGGGGQVFKARHRHMGRIVAMKVLPAEMMSSPLTVKRFAREVKAAARLLHPNIVTAFDAGKHDSIHYLAMEFVAGHSLAELVGRDGPFPIGRAVDFTIQIATGLAYAHRKGIIHRDIKPSNVMLSDDDEIKILDMGLARVKEISTHGGTGSDGSLTEHGYVIGSLGYMSPEQATSAYDVDHRTDVYSLGCTLFYLLTGNVPFEGSLLQTLTAQANDPTPSLRSYRPDIPRGLDAVCQHMLAKLPTERIQRMDDVCAQLQPWVGIESTGPVRAEPVSTASTVRGPAKTTAHADNRVQGSGLRSRNAAVLRFVPWRGWTPLLSTHGVRECGNTDGCSIPK